jgi:hypothetical protein
MDAKVRGRLGGQRLATEHLAVSRVGAREEKPRLDGGRAAVGSFFVGTFDTEHQLRGPFPVNLCRHLLAQLLTELMQARARGIEIDVIARGREGHQDTRRRWRGYDGCEHEPFEASLVEVAERIGQRVEHLTTDLQVLVVALATTSFFVHVAPRHGYAAPD